MAISRRIVAVPVSGQLLAELLTQAQDQRFEAHRVERGLPPGARFFGVHHDALRQEVVLVFEHESFAEVGSGDAPPRLAVMAARLCRSCPDCMTECVACRGSS